MDRGKNIVFTAISGVKQKRCKGCLPGVQENTVNQEKQMKIALISTAYKSTPPNGYGGIERVVYLLAEELIKAGHEVILFGAQGSHCSGKTIEVTAYNPNAAPSGIHSRKDIISEEHLYDAVSDYIKKEGADIIHDWSFQNLFVLRNADKYPFVISTCVPPPPDYSRPNLVACSRAHAELCGTGTKHVYYGLDLENWEYSFSKKERMIHISKIAKYKGQHLAIMAANRANKELIIAGNIADPFYYYTAVKPLLIFFPKVSYIGEIKGTNSYLKDAAALIQTPRWFDAFPLVILEAFASGTPVISLAEGGIPEQIVDGLNGFVCKTLDDMVAAMKKVGQINPKDCRAYAEKNFSAKRMADDYLELYKQAINGKKW